MEMTAIKRQYRAPELGKPQKFKIAHPRQKRFVDMAGALILLTVFAPVMLLVALAVHGVGVLACLNEPRLFDLWITRMR